MRAPDTSTCRQFFTPGPRAYTSGLKQWSKVSLPRGEELKKEVKLDGRRGYVSRRVLFKGLRVALLMGSLADTRFAFSSLVSDG